MLHFPTKIIGSGLVIFAFLLNTATSCIDPPPSFSPVTSEYLPYLLFVSEPMSGGYDVWVDTVIDAHSINGVGDTVSVEVSFQLEWVRNASFREIYGWVANTEYSFSDSANTRLAYIVSPSNFEKGLPGLSFQLDHPVTGLQDWSVEYGDSTEVLLHQIWVDPNGAAYEEAIVLQREGIDASASSKMVFLPERGITELIIGNFQSHILE